MGGKALSGGDKIHKALADIARKMGGGSVSIGFMEGAVYPDGTPVAAVAFWNEYGGPNRQPRPFFRQMIAKESPGWPSKMAALAKASNYDGPMVLTQMGEDVKGALVQSINDFTTPALAPSTIKAKGFPKPLIDTADMLRAVDYKVDA